MYALLIRRLKVLILRAPPKKTRGLAISPDPVFLIEGLSGVGGVERGPLLGREYQSLFFVRESVKNVAARRLTGGLVWFAAGRAV